MEFLKSNIFDTCIKFRISDKIKNPAHLSGSMGFISYLDGLDDSYQNVADINTVIIRKGKTGKERLFFCKLRIPIFVFDGKQFAKILPTIENRRNFVYIDRENDQLFNLMDTDSLDFIGWATAMSSKLKLMSSRCKHSRWPSGNKNPVNKMLQLPDYFGDDPLAKLEFFGNPDFRHEFLNEARVMYSSMVKIHLEREKIKAGCELNASEFLEFTNKGKFLEKKNAENEYKFTDDNALLERTIKHYKAAKKDIEVLCKNKTK